jgi:hypothetical protein
MAASFLVRSLIVAFFGYPLFARTHPLVLGILGRAHRRPPLVITLAGGRYRDDHLTVETGP